MKLFCRIFLSLALVSFGALCAATDSPAVPAAMPVVPPAVTEQQSNKQDAPAATEQQKNIAEADEVYIPNNPLENKRLKLFVETTLYHPSVQLRVAINRGMLNKEEWERLIKKLAKNLGKHYPEIIRSTPEEMLNRLAAFLIATSEELKDTKGFHLGLIVQPAF